MKMRDKTALFIAISLALCVSLSACSNTGNDTQPNDMATESATSKIDVPEFSGPYAAEFSQAYLATKSELARKILATGVISESSFAEVQQKNKVCLENQDFTDVTYSTEGGGSFKAPEGLSDEEVFAIDKQCMEESGLSEIETLYTGLLTNPNNEDWDQLQIKCLIDSGVVEPSFTVEDLNTMYDRQDPQLGAGGSAAACTSDPLGLLGK